MSTRSQTRNDPLYYSRRSCLMPSYVRKGEIIMPPVPTVSELDEYIDREVEKTAVVTVNLPALPRPLAAAVRYLAELSWSHTIESWAALPVSEAARMLGVPRSTLIWWGRGGKGGERRFGRGGMVDGDAARQYLISKLPCPERT